MGRTTDFFSVVWQIKPQTVIKVSSRTKSTIRSMAAITTAQLSYFKSGPGSFRSTGTGIDPLPVC